MTAAESTKSDKKPIESKIVSGVSCRNEEMKCMNVATTAMYRAAHAALRKGFQRIDQLYAGPAIAPERYSLDPYVT